MPAIKFIQLILKPNKMVRFDTYNKQGILEPFTGDFESEELAQGFFGKQWLILAIKRPYAGKGRNNSNQRRT